MNVWQRLDFQRGITDQDPKARYVVLFAMSATYMCANVVERGRDVVQVGQQQISLQSFIADYKTFSFETSEKEEAHYLASVLNSPLVDELLKPMQSRGLWGPRDICKKVLELPIPEFSAKNPKHMKLAEMAEACAEKVKEMVPDLRKLFEDGIDPKPIIQIRRINQGIGSDFGTSLGER